MLEENNSAKQQYGDWLRAAPVFKGKSLEKFVSGGGGQGGRNTTINPRANSTDWSGSQLGMGMGDQRGNRGACTERTKVTSGRRDDGESEPESSGNGRKQMGCQQVGAKISVSRSDEGRVNSL